MRFKTSTDLLVLAEGFRHMARIYIEHYNDHEKGRELFQYAKDIDTNIYEYGNFVRRIGQKS